MENPQDDSQFDKQGTEDVSSKSSIEEIEKQLKGLGIQEISIESSADAPSPQVLVEVFQVLLEKWHRVVAPCNENPRWLLAAALSGIKDNLTASEILKSRDLLPDERDEVQIDGIPSNLFKRKKDSTLTQSTVNLLGEFMKSVGYLICQQITSGTVFRVGDRYVMTAWHLIAPIKHEWYSMPSHPSSPDHNIPAVFVSFKENPHTPPLYRLRPPCFSYPNLDIAILEIDNPNPSLPPPLPLSKTDGPKSHVSFIGYGHPQIPLIKHLDFKCDVLTVNSEKVMQSMNMFLLEKPRIRDCLKQNDKSLDLLNTAFNGYDDPSCFIVDSYFEHGGSGSPAIDHSCPFSPQVVGIYNKGFPSFFFDLPIDMQKRYGSKYRFEMCTRMSSVYSDLMRCDGALAQQIFG